MTKKNSNNSNKNENFKTRGNNEHLKLKTPKGIELRKKHSLIMKKTGKLLRKHKKPKQILKRNHVTRTLMITTSKRLESAYVRTQTRNIVYPSWAKHMHCGYQRKFKVLVK